MGIDLTSTTFNFLDLETTGFSAKTDRIIEVYVSKVQDGRVLENFHTLVNPQVAIPRDIVYLTAIPVSELQFAPSFDEISTKLMSFLGDDVVVAHNARFDIGFLRNEFAKVGMPFKNHYCCTVKVSRFLYPHYRRHGLSHIINRLEIDEELLAGVESGRHRADYDTEVIKVFFYKSLEKFGTEKFVNAVDRAMQSKAKPTNMLDFDFDKIPNKPGVYIFYGETLNDKLGGKPDTTRTPLYIGMSKDLKRRVFDHLYSSTTYEKDFDITNQVKEIKVIETAGILGAKLRESHLIKTMLPTYNSKLRKKGENCNYRIHIDDNGYYNLTPRQSTQVNLEDIKMSVDLIGGDKFVKLMLNEYIKKFGLCAKLLGLEGQNKKKDANKACFYYHLGQCKGACIKEITPDDYNTRFKEAFERFMIEKWPFDGKLEFVESSDTLSETFYIDNWCLLGSSNDDLPCQSKENIVFDRDVYQILKSHLK